MIRAQKQNGLHTFYALIFTQVLSLIGSRISALAISIWIYQQTANATPLGLVAFFQILPHVLGASFAGVLADRYNRRLLLALSDLGQAVGTIFLIFSFASGNFQLWHLYAVAFFQAIFATLQSPTFIASVTMLVPDSQRDRANALTQLVGPLAGIIAPPLAGAVYASMGISGAILIDFFTFLVAALILFLSPIPQPPQTAEGRAVSGSLLQEFIGGLRYLWHKRPLFYCALLIAMLNFLLSGLSVILTPYLLSRTGSEAAMGILLSLTNVGALVGGVLFSIWGGMWPRIHIFLLGVFIAGCIIGLNGMAQHPFLIALCLFAYMVPIPMVNAAILSIFQVKVAPDFQGRVFAVMGQMAMVMTPLSYILIGVLADNVFEPALSTPLWGLFAPIWGEKAGSGIGLMISFSGFMAAIVSLIAYSVPPLRRLEGDLPDHTSPIAEADIARPSETTPAPIHG